MQNIQNQINKYEEIKKLIKNYRQASKNIDDSNIKYRNHRYGNNFSELENGLPPNYISLYDPQNEMLRISTRREKAKIDSQLRTIYKIKITDIKTDIDAIDQYLMKLRILMQLNNLKKKTIDNIDMINNQIHDHLTSVGQINMSQSLKKLIEKDIEEIRREITSEHEAHQRQYRPPTKSNHLLISDSEDDQQQSNRLLSKGSIHEAEQAVWARSEPSQNHLNSPYYQRNPYLFAFLLATPIAPLFLMAYLAWKKELTWKMGALLTLATLTNPVIGPALFGLSLASHGWNNWKPFGLSWLGKLAAFVVAGIGIALTGLSIAAALIATGVMAVSGTIYGACTFLSRVPLIGKACSWFGKAFYGLCSFTANLFGHQITHTVSHVATSAATISTTNVILNDIAGGIASCCCAKDDDSDDKRNNILHKNSSHLFDNHLAKVNSMKRNSEKTIKDVNQNDVVCNRFGNSF